MVAAEEKGLVPDDRSTNDAAKLIAFQLVTAQSACVASVENSVSHEFKQVAMELVRARLRHQVDLTTGMVAVLSREAAGFHFKLCQSIGKWQRQVQVVEGIIVSPAVEYVVRSSRQPAADGKNNGGIIPCSTRLEVLVGRGLRIRHSSEEDQFGDLASVERKLQHALAVHHLANARASCLHHCCVGQNIDLIADRTEFERDIDDWIAVHTQHDPGLDVSPEALQSDFQHIRTDREVRQRVVSGLIRYDVPGQPRGSLRSFHFHARQNSSRLICYGPIDLPRRTRLRDYGAAGKHEKGHYAAESLRKPAHKSVLLVRWQRQILPILIRRLGRSGLGIVRLRNLH